MKLSDEYQIDQDSVEKLQKLQAKIKKIEKQRDYAQGSLKTMQLSLKEHLQKIDNISDISDENILDQAEQVIDQLKIKLKKSVNLFNKKMIKIDKIMKKVMFDFDDNI